MLIIDNLLAIFFLNDVKSVQHKWLYILWIVRLSQYVLENGHVFYSSDSIESHVWIWDFQTNKIAFFPWLKHNHSKQTKCLNNIFQVFPITHNKWISYDSQRFEHRYAVWHTASRCCTVARFHYILVHVWHNGLYPHPSKFHRVQKLFSIDLPPIDFYKVEKLYAINFKTNRTNIT